jgi:hypothetical protein
VNRRGVTLFVHPVTAKASRSVDLGIDVSILEFMFDTTRVLTNMIFSGAKKRFSRINITSTHGGGTIPYLMSRIETLEKVFGPGKGRAHLSSAGIREGFSVSSAYAISPSRPSVPASAGNVAIAPKRVGCFETISASYSLIRLASWQASGPFA